MNLMGLGIFRRVWMKLTTITWVKDALLLFIARLIEVAFRVILFILPLGVFLLVLQNRSKVSSVSSLSAFTNDNSVWQHVFPGFILISVDQKQFRNNLLKVRERVQGWIKENRGLIDILFMFLVVLVLVILEIRG